MAEVLSHRLDVRFNIIVYFAQTDNQISAQLLIESVNLVDLITFVFRYEIAESRLDDVNNNFKFEYQALEISLPLAKLSHILVQKENSSLFKISVFSFQTYACFPCIKMIISVINCIYWRFLCKKNELRVLLLYYCSSVTVFLFLSGIISFLYFFPSWKSFSFIPKINFILISAFLNRSSSVTVCQTSEVTGAKSVTTMTPTLATITTGRVTPWSRTVYAWRTICSSTTVSTEKWRSSDPPRLRPRTWPNSTLMITLNSSSIMLNPLRVKCQINCQPNFR